MPFEWKEFITPAITMAGFWIAARLALRNEIRKKALELEAVHLERLAVECDSCLRNLHLYCMRVERLLHDLSDRYEKRVTLAELTDGLQKSANAGTAIDLNAARMFQNTLELHRPDDFAEWKALIVPLLNHINNIHASPSLATDDCTEELSRKYYSPEQAKIFNEELVSLASPLPAFRQQLFQRIAHDYRLLTHPAPLNLWTLLAKGRNAILAFFKKPPI